MRHCIKLCILLFAVGFIGNYIGRWQASWDIADSVVYAENIDPNELKFIPVEWVEITEPNNYDHVDYGAMDYSLLVICLEDGTELRMDWSGNRIDVKGDADMNEAAKVWFNESLKSCIDVYIEEQLKK